MQDINYNTIYNNEINNEEKDKKDKKINNDIFDTFVSLITEYYLMNNK